MNKWFLIILVLVTAVVFYSGRKESVTQITPEQVKIKMTNENSILLDVRTPMEYQEGHIKDSLLIPLDNLEKEAKTLIPDKEQKIFVYCRSGNRSKTAVKILKDLGYEKVYNAGGIINWPYPEDIVK